MFQFFTLSPPGLCDPGIPIAATRAGVNGLLDVSHLPPRAAGAIPDAIGRLLELSRDGVGLILSGCGKPLDDLALRALEDADRRVAWIVLAGAAEPRLREALERCRPLARQIGLVATSGAEAALAEEVGADFLFAKGYEAGGHVGAETGFVLLQKLLSRSRLPVYAWGGIGLHSVAACRAAGAAGVVVDWPLALTRESALPLSLRHRIRAMDGTESQAIAGPDGRLFRAWAQPGTSGEAWLREASDETALSDADTWAERIEALVAAPNEDECLWPIGQDVAFASSLAENFPTVARVVDALRERSQQALTHCTALSAKDERSPLAVSHGTTYPIVQGPMTRVSDLAGFCDAVERGGALPFLALANMRRDAVARLLRETDQRMGSRPWGVGILGFAERDLRAEQLEAIEEVRPPFAIIAGGRIDQADTFEAKGITTYLHAPSPMMLQGFVAEGARRFIFEGQECGGHVGPRSSFVLWDESIRTLLAADLAPEEAAKVHVLFAGGIHDARSAAMVLAMAEPLAEKGMKVGLLLGTAYLFTEEAVSTGAIVREFQETALRADRTVLLESGPGHAIRCADSDYAREFAREKRRLTEEGCSVEEVRDELERLDLGRLRIASKGIVRESDEASGEYRYLDVGTDVQRRDGMYMLGQVAALHAGTCTIADLHASIWDGALVRLAGLGRAASEISVEEAAAAPAPCDVAIVGMGCLLPGARSVHEYWDNILGKRDQIREVPEDRFDASRWFHPDRGERDRIYSRHGGFLDDIRFDPLKYGIPPQSLKQIEPGQLLALEVVDQALHDAGYDREIPEREHTGVVFGVSGGLGDLGQQYVFRSLLPQFVENPDETLWEQLPEWTEDSFPGLLPNVITGRVSNRFDLGGPNFTVDAACGSSLAALYVAVRELSLGTAKMMIAGGCDLVQNSFAFMCFAKTGALSPGGHCRPFDTGADGIAISEGLGALVLKRLTDAERDGDRIYAVVRGVAAGSDGRHLGLTAPSRDGQLRTIRRAYATAGVDPAAVGLVEAHGTGTALGDRTEIEALAGFFRESGAQARSVAVGSVKSMIGHTKSTAGVASLIKIACALHDRVLPPTIGVDEPTPVVRGEDSPVYLNTELRPWVLAEGPRRAGVSSFGFGGTNYHAVIEEYTESPLARRSVAPLKRRPAELFAFAAASEADLERRVRDFADRVQRLLAADPEVALADLAYTLHLGTRASGEVEARAAVVVSDVAELGERLDALAGALASESADEQAPASGVFFTRNPLGWRAQPVFLFPGQGSQFPNMLLDLALDFPEVGEAFDRADAVLDEAYDRPLSRFVFPPPPVSREDRSKAVRELTATSVAQPALGVCGAAMFRLLAGFGVQPSAVAGHSYGELTALHVAGVYSEKSLYKLSWQRGAAMDRVTTGSGQGDPGQMLAVHGEERKVRSLISGLDGVWLANLNAPDQTVISGTRRGLEEARQRLESAGMSTSSIPVACAFHSPLVAPARKEFARSLREHSFSAPELDVFSNTTSKPYPHDAEEMRSLLEQQLVSEVRFLDQIENMYTKGARVFVEVGPNRVLSGLTGRILSDQQHVAIATQPGDGNGTAQLLSALAGLFVHGISVDFERLYEGRDLARLDVRGLLARKKAREAAHMWQVNGGYVRPDAEAPRGVAPRARLAGGTPEAPVGPGLSAPGAEAQAAIPSGAPAGWETRAPGAVVHAEPSPVGPSDLDLDAYDEFQKTMRQFLQVQERVLSAFFAEGAGAAPRPVDLVPEEAGPARAEGAFEAPVHREPTPAPAVPVEAAAPSAPAESPELSEAAIQERLVEIISERTGYPPDMLGLDANLEGDLGIDSIKRVEIVAFFRREFLPSLEEPPEWFMEDISGSRTLRAISQAFLGLGQEVAGGSRDEVSEAAALPAPDASAPTLAGDCPRCVGIPVEAPLDESPGDGLLKGAFLLTAEGEEPAGSVVRALEAEGAWAVPLNKAALWSPEAAAEAIERARREHGEIAGVIHLLPLREAPEFPGTSAEDWSRFSEVEVKGFFYLMQALESELSASREGAFRVLCATRGGGDFLSDAPGEASHPWRGGLAGLLKTAAQEWEGARFRAVDLEAYEPERLGAILLRELRAPGAIDVGYRDGRRLTVRAVTREPERVSPSFDLDSESVVLALGGARGITARIALEMARRWKCRFVLLGRSQLEDEELPLTAGIDDPVVLRQVLVTRMREEGQKPSPAEVERRVQRILFDREIAANLAEFERVGARVEYISCDATDHDELASTLRDVERRHGGIDVILHGAGVIEDELIPQKSSESYDRVVLTKIEPLLTLAELVDPKRLKFLMLFSSVAGFHGNPGQGDYSIANEMLNRMGRRLDALWPARVVSMNWGPWDGGGMVGPEVRRNFERRGISMVEVAEGIRRACEELGRMKGDPVRVIVGGGPWVDSAET